MRLTEANEVRGGGGTEEWEALDLRRDLILMCHDLNSHPQIGETVTAVNSQRWWRDGIV